MILYHLSGCMGVTKVLGLESIELACILRSLAFSLSLLGPIIPLLLGYCPLETGEISACLADFTSSGENQERESM